MNCLEIVRGTSYQCRKHSRGSVLLWETVSEEWQDSNGGCFFIGEALDGVPGGTEISFYT